MTIQMISTRLTVQIVVDCNDSNKLAIPIFTLHGFFRMTN